jgi:hypothetical protein
VHTYASTAAYMCQGQTSFSIDPDAANNHWGSLDGFSGDVCLNFDTSLFEVWDPSNQLCAELSFKLLYEICRIVEYDAEN